MIQQTLEEIERKLASASTLSPAARQELSSLLGQLKEEMAVLAETHAEEARSITGFTEVSAYEVTRTEKNPRLIHYAIAGLMDSVAGFEKSHPRLVEIVNSMATTLSNLGI